VIVQKLLAMIFVQAAMPGAIVFLEDSTKAMALITVWWRRRSRGRDLRCLGFYFGVGEEEEDEDPFA
jgi:hypothetical protein